MSDEVKHVDVMDDGEDHEDHPLPVGALVMTLAYLALITTPVCLLYTSRCV